MAHNPKKNINRRQLATIVLFITGLFVHPPLNASQSSEIHTLTVAFLFNFIKLSQWPEAAVRNELVLCVVQTENNDSNLDQLGGKNVQNQTLVVKHLVQGDAVQACHVLFIPDDEKPIRIPNWLNQVATLPILTVGASENFLAQGGMIALVNEANHLQFEVNLLPVKQVGITLSSKMLEIARSIRGQN